MVAESIWMAGTAAVALMTRRGSSDSFVEIKNDRGRTPRGFAAHRREETQSRSGAKRQPISCRRSLLRELQADLTFG